MIEDRFDELREAARDYNAPPETPRDEMWERIVAARTKNTKTTERTGTPVIPLRPSRGGLRFERRWEVPVDRMRARA